VALPLGIELGRRRERGTEHHTLEPERDDHTMFFTNIFSFSARRTIAEHAYRTTRRDLLRRRDELEPLLRRHGVRLRTEVLQDESRELWPGVALSSPLAPPVVQEMDRVLSRLEALLGA